MITSAVAALSARLDSQFLSAYVMPAFIALSGIAGLLIAPVGLVSTIERLQQFGSVEQALLFLWAAILILMLAFMLRALSLPIFEVFTGLALPSFVSDPMIRSQLRVRDLAVQRLEIDLGELGATTRERKRAILHANYFPADVQDTGPTVFGNVLNSAADHPRAAYHMSGTLWLPRLLPLLPGDFRSTLTSAQNPMMCFLNLSLVFVVLAVSAAVAGIIERNWIMAVVVPVGCLLLARWSYLGGVSQATHVASLMRVAFDLYRQSILDQLGIAPPEDATAEQLIWDRLTRQLTSAIEVRGGNLASAEPGPSGNGISMASSDETRAEETTTR